MKVLTLTKKLWILVVLLAVTITWAYAAAADSKANPGTVPARTLDYIHLGSQAVRQEFVWDDTAGVFKTVNLYTTGAAGDHAADVNRIMQGGASGDGSLVGQSFNYTYWNGTQWVTLDKITRYEGVDDRAEAIVNRYDLTFYTQSTTSWQEITGYNTIYGTLYTTGYFPIYATTYSPLLQPIYEHVNKTRTYRRDEGGAEFYDYETYVVAEVVGYETHFIPHQYEVGSSSQILGSHVVPVGYETLYGTFSSITNVPAAFDPVVDITLANGWSVSIHSHYDQWGNEVHITSPSGQTSIVYGDPHLVQAGGTQQQELAAIGNYVFDLGGYTMDLSCNASNGGFSLVTDLTLTGPNGYTLTYGRNNEVKVSGGTF